MTITAAVRCDGPGCLRFVQAKEGQTGPPYGSGFLTVFAPPVDTRHFCGWDCALRYGSQYEPEGDEEGE